MNIGLWEILLAIAIVIAAALCCYQFLKYRQVLAILFRKKQKEEVVQAQKQAELKSSVRTLCLCLVQNQVELSEGCWRVKLHLDHLFPIASDREDFHAFYRMFDEISSFDTHEKRNDLSKQERFNQDKKRFEIEERYRDEIIEASQKLLSVLDQ